MGLSLKTNSADQDQRWPPASLHSRGWIDEAGVRLVSQMGALLHRVYGPSCDDRFGILMYHRIADNVPGQPKPSINVTPDRFRKQIEGLLAQGFVFWPLSKVLEFRRRAWTIFPWVSVITFDDGFQGVYHHAWQVLKDLNVPATVFLSTAYLDSDDPFPFDHWAHAHHAHIPVESYRPLTHAQCLEMATHGLIELGAHTHTHQDFRGRPDEFRRDLSTNLDALRASFQVTQPAFSFPYGTPRMGFTSEELVAAARDTGVHCGLTTESSLIGHDTSPFHWGRIHAFPWDTGRTLAAKLAGWYSWGPQLRHGMKQFSLRPGSQDSPLQTPEGGNGISLTRGAVQAAIPRESICQDAALVPEEGDPTAGRLARPLISVIVPTFNRAPWLADALASLVGQETADRFDFEIIVVDNASIDNTREVVERMAVNSRPAILYLLQPKPGDAPTRNRGREAAAGVWLAFFDDDQLAEPNWLLELFDAAVTTEVMIVGGPVHLDLKPQQLQCLGPLCRQLLRETKLYSRIRPYAKRHLPGTGNALVARSVFETIGAFDESLPSGGSDLDFFTRAREQGYALVYSPRAVIRHRVAADRLSAEYFRWDALSGGAEHAVYFDYQKRGTAALLALCLARIALALLVHLPLLFVAWLRCDPGGVLGRRARLWRIEGYLRKTLALLAPRLFPQQRFFESLKFRRGGSLLGVKS